MPKRSATPRRERKKCKKQKLSNLAKELDLMKKRIKKALSSSSSDSSDNGEITPTHPSEESVDTDSEREIEIEDHDEPVIGETPPKNNEPEDELESILGVKPKNSDEQGPDIHEEIIVRWNSYLTKGINKEERTKVLEKHPVPKNCQALLPPKINGEIGECMTEAAAKKDYFLKSLQHQIGHGLAAIGSVMDALIKNSTKSDHLSQLADAAQIFGNVHNAVSVLRRQNILPLLNADSQKVGRSAPIDEYLFGSNFGDSLKANQALKKTGGEIKKKSWYPTSATGARTNVKGIAANNSSVPHHLNYQRHPFKTRIKTKGERDSRGNPKTPYQQRRRP